MRHVAAARVWRRWWERVLRSRLTAEQRRTVGSWTRRSRLLRGWLSWRVDTLEARAVIGRRLALRTWVCRLRVLLSLSTWRERARGSRTLSKREQMCRRSVIGSRRASAWVTWRVWALRRFYNAALASSHRYGIWLVRRAIVAWHVVVLCIARGQVRVQCLARSLLGAWLVAAVKDRVRKIVEATSRICVLRMALYTWMEALRIVLETSRALVAACASWAKRCCRRALCAWRKYLVRRLRF